MTMQEQISVKIRQNLQADVLEVINESHGHNVPAGSQTHFKVVVVSPGFSGVTPVARHRQLYQILAEELKQGVHALALHTYTPEEWQLLEQAPQSPACKGGSKH